MAFTPKVQRQIILDNLQMESRTMSSTLEARLSHLSDYARLLVDSLETPSVKEILHLIDEAPLLVTASPLHKEALPVHKDILAGGLLALSRWDKVHLCQYLARFMEKKFGEIPSDLFYPCGSEISRVAYLPTGFTEEAFDIFSASLADAKVLHAEDYEGSCMAVAIGDADACILPYRDETGDYVRMTQGYLDTFGLFVTALYTVYDGEDSGIEYALCCKALPVAQGAYRLHLRLSPLSATGVEDFLSSMGLFHMTPTQVSYTHEHLSLWLKGNTSPLPLFLWLTLFTGGYSLGGLITDSI